MLKMERLGKTDRDGLPATVTLAIDPEAIPAPVDGFGGRGPARRTPDWRTDEQANPPQFVPQRG
jgi:hypothetical protein